ncbi:MULTISPECIES: hypothetical protein [Bacillus]|uniref:hypothetical protein n=1 Tax=Bacillus TaxID=1386 RepID=UPI000858736D|nr:MULTISPECIES: hypothetical protein [Bacillus]AZJ21261.1 hypothetical protein CT694_16990 [Bacillus wiedmannii bv. thuringiensis]MBJ8110186.1 hypothetical protein [Bacillus cereus group sp. N6]OWT47447.1 hypothetical protein CER22_31240 [Bacillus sp. K2I17]PRT22234.1 hypothetical protein C6360_11825 [Bacillus wiedmannii]QWH67155.1 hypothetical protein EXW41_15785 [Bacillus wiedmannii]
MYQYWYLNSEGNGEQYTNQIAMSSLYLQPQITKAEGMNDLKIPENWSCRGYPFGWDSPAYYTGFNPQTPPFSLGQPIHYAGMMPQGHPANWTPLQGHVGNLQKPPLPWAQPFNHAGMFAQGHLAALLSPPAKAFNFNTNNNWGIFGNPPGWGGQVSPMGWGNNGQPGMLGNLLTVGKGTMNGIGMLSSLIGMGKFFF